MPEVFGREVRFDVQRGHPELFPLVVADLLGGAVVHIDELKRDRAENENAVLGMVQGVFKPAKSFVLLAQGAFGLPAFGDTAGATVSRRSAVRPAPLRSRARRC